MWRPSRSVRQIDADLRALWRAQCDAQAELEQIRHRQSELAEMEAELVVDGELRCRRVDVLLDERLRAAGPAEDVRAASGSSGSRPAAVPGIRTGVAAGRSERLPTQS